ncbi:MAG: hypothetical protein QM608_16325 [Caulobacter sp.]
MRKIAFAAAAAVVLGAGLWGCEKAPETPKPAVLVGKAVITPVPLPTTADYPVAQATIQGWIDASNTAAIRNHAWMLWQAMSQPSGQVFNGQDLPIWDTWAGSDEVFPPAPTGLQAAADAPKTTVADRVKAPRSPHQFISPNQFHHGRGGIPSPQFDGAITAFNKFSPEAAAFIDSTQQGPGGTYTYSNGNDLGLLNEAWPASTPAQNRTINAFPVRGIELKPVFGLVKATGLTIQPLWQGPAGSTDAKNPMPPTWTTCVLIDPNGKGEVRPATKKEIAEAPNAAGAAYFSACKTFLWGPLSSFYAVKLSAAEAADFNAANAPPPTPAPPLAAEGDYAVLQAMHVNTKEIPFWTWQTFWWQPGGDTPNGFPGSKQGQPSSLKTPWTNYASCTAYDQTTTPGGSTMTVCFNPYLETSTNIPAGITSNCMSCHGVAVIAANAPYPLAYKAPIQFFTDTTYFTTSNTQTDFSWAVAGAAVVPPKTSTTKAATAAKPK